MLTAAVQENVLVQLEHLITLPAVASRLIHGDLRLHGWVYKIETGEVFAFDSRQGQFVPLTEYQLATDELSMRRRTRPTSDVSGESNAMMNLNRRTFWQDAFAIHGSVTPKVLPDVGIFGLYALAVSVFVYLWERWFGVRLGLEVAPHELVGAALGLLLILRTNAGYDRWWEARKLWGGIVNQSRNLAISGIAYGPPDPAWREQFVRWTAAFPYICRVTLRNQTVTPEVDRLVGSEAAARISQAAHPPSAVALQLASLLKSAVRRRALDRISFLQIDKERAQLIDHIGACERILKTPLALVYSIKIRRFLALFLFSLPFALVHRLHAEWLVPLLTMLVAYPLLALDRIGSELQNPFAENNLSHLPLSDISTTIEQNVIGLMCDADYFCGEATDVSRGMDGHPITMQNA